MAPSIVKPRKSFTDSELIKDCMIVAVKEMYPRKLINLKTSQFFIKHGLREQMILQKIN